MLECMTHKLGNSLCFEYEVVERVQIDIHRDRTTSTETSPLPVQEKDILLHHTQKHTHTQTNRHYHNLHAKYILTIDSPLS